MPNASCSREHDEIRASILGQRIRRDYLEHMLNDAKMLESAHGLNYLREISSALEDLKRRENGR